MPASKPVRQTQLISPFGIGAMVDFPRDESLMPAGLDTWPRATEQCPPESGWLIREERLEASLGVTHFRMPPDFRETESGGELLRQNIPFVRFPRWHYCHRCGSMELLSPFSPRRERCRGRKLGQMSCDALSENRRPFLLPVRFVAACENGHLQDFPFMGWVHGDKPQTESCHLRMRAGRSSAGLAGIMIECTCGAKRSMNDVFPFDREKGGVLSRMKHFCQGVRPWLGETESEGQPCNMHLRVLQRGASNVYFPHVVSSIYLPLWAEKVDSRIIAVLEDQRFWQPLSQATTNGRIDRQRCELIAGIASVDGNQLEVAAQRKLEGNTQAQNPIIHADMESFRYAEYQAMREGKVGPDTDLYVQVRQREEYDEDIARLFSRICIVHKLRETRVLAGFTRILPPDVGQMDQRMQPLKLNPVIDWLPAIKVYGEGIFLELDGQSIENWLQQAPKMVNRINDLSRNYNNARIARGLPHRIVTPKFVMMHTLAHVLLNQLSFDCGYGSSSLRERLYCDVLHVNAPMHGILIYTASGDSEGTMGGLARQGVPGNLERVIRRAIIRAAWCSSDPICIESRGQGTDNANLAACHGCCLLPETSCEEGNRLLDRATLIGLLDKKVDGYFSSVAQ